MSAKQRISFQGASGAYSDIAARHLYPDGEGINCGSFKEALDCLKNGHADCAVIPVTNSAAGPVTTSIELLRQAEYIVLKKFWLPIHHCLLALPQAGLSDIRSVHSHWQALKQCKANIEKLGLQVIEESDTAKAAKKIAEEKDITKAAIASAHAAQEYKLKILKENFEDEADNRTLFLALALKNTPQTENLGSAKEVLTQLGL